MNRRAALRLAPEIPETTTGPAKRIISLEIDRMRAREAQIETAAARAQGLSLRLAHLYGRDVFADDHVEGYHREATNGCVYARDGVPPRSLMESADWTKMKVSFYVAERLLARDTGMPMAPDVVRPEPFRMPTLAELLAVEEVD